jgi:glycosyltransferase involved in cell wall biosynthesis
MGIEAEVDFPIRVLFVTSQWPSSDKPGHSPFVRSAVEALRQAGVFVDVYHYKGEWNLYFYFRSVIGFHRKLRADHYDLVHAYFGQCGLVALSQRKLPVVVRFGGSDLIGWYDENGYEPLSSKLLRNISRQVAQRADQVILPSQALERYLPRQDYSIIPGGIDLELFRPMDKTQAKTRLGFTGDEKLVLFASDPSRIVKRYHLAEEAVAIVAKQLRTRLVITSNLAHEQMPLYMNACDVLLLTSQHEGSPNVVKEALACNLPVVSVDVGDVRERIGHSPSCRVTNGVSAEEISHALNEVLMGGRQDDLRSLVLSLDQKLIAGKTIDVYKKMIRTNPKKDRIRSN